MKEVKKKEKTQHNTTKINNYFFTKNFNAIMSPLNLTLYNISEFLQIEKVIFFP